MKWYVVNSGRYFTYKGKPKIEILVHTFNIRNGTEIGWQEIEDIVDFDECAFKTKAEATNAKATNTYKQSSDLVVNEYGLVAFLL
jgi:hypothetical protein